MATMQSRPTIFEAVTRIKNLGLRLLDRESTWAESKWWFQGTDECMEKAIGLVQSITGEGRAVYVSVTEERELFVSFPKNKRAEVLLDEGMDPGDLE